MSISDKQIQQQFQEIFLNMYKKVKNQKLSKHRFHNEIKQQMYRYE